MFSCSLSLNVLNIIGYILNEYIYLVKKIMKIIVFKAK